MPRNRLRVCTAQPLLPAKTGTRIPRVVLIYLQTHERRHMRYSLLDLSFSGDLRNDLYLTLVRGEFERGSKTAGKNIEVRVVVLDSEGNIQVIIVCYTMKAVFR